MNRIGIAAVTSLLLTASCGGIGVGKVRTAEVASVATEYAPCPERKVELACPAWEQEAFPETPRHLIEAYTRSRAAHRECRRSTEAWNRAWTMCKAAWAAE